MSEIEIFKFDDNPVRVIIHNGEPWWVAKDVCDALGLADFRTSLRTLDEDERHTVPVTDNLGREQDTYIINEPGLYSLILRSRKLEAKRFKRWITHEVLPTIRKTGGYLQPETVDWTDPVYLNAVLQESVRANLKLSEDNRKLELEVEAAQPMVAAFEAAIDIKDCTTVRDVTRILRDEHHFRITETQLKELLILWNWREKGSTAARVYGVNQGYMVNKLFTPHHSDKVITHGLVTPKGVKRIVEKLHGLAKAVAG